MTYTTQQLQVMSDDELFDALGEKFNSYIRRSALHEDIMPLAFERKIGLAPNKDSWEAFTLADNFQVISRQYIDKSPLRAIACLLLLMED